MNELKHYGVKGMRWGVRRTAAQLGRAVAKAGRKVGSSLVGEAKRYVQSRPAYVKRLSDNEIRNRIARLELEQSYSAMMKRSSKKVKQGESLVKSMLTNATRNIGTQAVTYFMGSAVNRVVGSEIVNPKKGQKDK